MTGYFVVYKRHAEHETIEADKMSLRDGYYWFTTNESRFVAVVDAAEVRSVRTVEGVI